MAKSRNISRRIPQQAKPVAASPTARFWPSKEQITPPDRQLSHVATSPNLLTGSELFKQASKHLREKSNKRTGEHMDIIPALREAAARGWFPKSTLNRCLAIIRLLFTDPSTGRVVEFGKCFSESGNEHARNAVIKNMETRCLALNACADRARYVLTAEDRKLAAKTNTAPATGQHLRKTDAGIV